jgi:hypothetical protein
VENVAVDVPPVPPAPADPAVPPAPTVHVTPAREVSVIEAVVA